MFTTSVFSLITDIEKQQDAPPSSRKRRSERSRGDKKKKPKIYTSVYEIGPPSWIKKEISTYALKRLLVSTTIPLLICAS